MTQQKFSNIYLAGPILGTTDEQCHDWRDEASVRLYPHPVFDPTIRDYRMNFLEHVDEIVETDKKEIMSSHAVLAYLPHPSAGTSMEIIYSYERGIPVFSVIPEGVAVSPWVQYHSHSLYTTLEAACEAVLQYLTEPSEND